MRKEKQMRRREQRTTRRMDKYGYKVIKLTEPYKKLLNSFLKIITIKEGIYYGI